MSTVTKPHERAKAARRFLDVDAVWAEDIVSRVLASCHPKQRAFVLDPGRRIAALCARGAGKTTAGLARFIIRMARTPKAKCLFIAQTKDDARELIWDRLQDTIENLRTIDADFSESRLECRFRRNGSMLKLVGADDDREVNKLRGKPRHEVGIDETAVFSAKRLSNIVHRAVGPRLGDYNGSLWMISTPGHNLAGLFYDATRPGSDKHRQWADREKPEFVGWTSWSSHAWSLKDGAETVPAIARLWAEALIEKDTEKWSDDNPIWRREYLGEWARDDTENIFRYRPHVDGKPWNQWDPKRVGPLQIAELPMGEDGNPRHDWLFGIGMDLGHADPFALNVLAVSPSDPSRTFYHVYGFEQTRMYAQLIAKHLLGEKADAQKPEGLIGALGWPVAMVADLAGLGGAVIDELKNVYGVACEPAVKAEKFGAIELFNGDLVDGRIKVLKGSKLEEQLLQLQWEVDEFGQVREGKGDQNHSTDSTIYIRRKLAALFDAGEIETTPQKPVYTDPMDLGGSDGESPESDTGGLWEPPGYGDEEWD